MYRKINNNDIEYQELVSNHDKYLFNDYIDNPNIYDINKYLNLDIINIIKNTYNDGDKFICDIKSDIYAYCNFNYYYDDNLSKIDLLNLSDEYYNEYDISNYKSITISTVLTHLSDDYFIMNYISYNNILLPDDIIYDSVYLIDQMDGLINFIIYIKSCISNTQLNINDINKLF